MNELVDLCLIFVCVMRTTNRCFSRGWWVYGGCFLINGRWGWFPGGLQWISCALLHLLVFCFSVKLSINTYWKKEAEITLKNGLRQITPRMFVFFSCSPSDKLNLSDVTHFSVARESRQFILSLVWDAGIRLFHSDKEKMKIKERKAGIIIHQTVLLISGPSVNLSGIFHHFQQHINWSEWCY